VKVVTNDRSITPNLKPLARQGAPHQSADRAVGQKCALTLGELAQKFRAEIKEARQLNKWARQQVKVDIQIVAVALTYGADTLYTDDESQTTFAELCGLNVMHTWNLPLSDAYRQGELELYGETGDATEDTDPV
jgi:hypothetical protein